MCQVNCWPAPSNDGTCVVNIEYDLENDKLELHDVNISIPLPYASNILDVVVKCLTLLLALALTHL